MERARINQPRYQTFGKSPTNIHRLRTESLVACLLWVDDVCGRNGTPPFIIANVDGLCVAAVCTYVRKGGRRGLTKGPVSGYKRRSLCHILPELGREWMFCWSLWEAPPFLKTNFLALVQLPSVTLLYTEHLTLDTTVLNQLPPRGLDAGSKRVLSATQQIMHLL